MSVIYHNNVILINSSEFELDGIYRVVAICPVTQDVAIIRIFQTILTPQLSTSENEKPKQEIAKISSIQKFHMSFLKDLEDEGSIRELELVLDSKQHQSIDQLNKKEKENFEKRKVTMLPFFDQKTLSKCIFSDTGVGSLISSQATKKGVSRTAIYNWLTLLLTFGFIATSLNPRFDNCGAPGKKRFANGQRKKAGRKTNRQRIDGHETVPQKMVEEAEEKRIVALFKQIKSPKKSNKEVYIEILNLLYSTKISLGKDGVVYEMPEQGTFINERQFRHIVDGIDKVKKIELSTTPGHYNRNLRGLKGKNHQNVAGPGHVYAIDSTIADAYLRSSINRAWVCGRPIVYIIVDVWSSAVVGFYVCWTGPSWRMAKVALFSVATYQQSLSNLWGVNNWLYLDPFPTLPFEFLCDRGEYLSHAATETALVTMFGLAYNPSYRPDLKGIVEVLHRIMKDQQYAYIPGAMDARKKEMELRKYNPESSSLTLREYVHYLIQLFNKYNQSADMRHRLDMDMIADSVVPTPAGLWSWGHQVGLGYRKNTNEQTLIKNLLPVGPARINKSGFSFAGQPYVADIVSTQQWSTLARNFGATETQVHFFPGSISKIWLPEGPSGLTEFNLSPYASAKPNISHDELLDALMFEKIKSQDREYVRTFNALMAFNQTQKIVSDAVKATAEAELAHTGEKPSIRTARDIEQKTITGFYSNKDSQTSVDIEGQAENVYSDLIAMMLKDSISGG